MRSTQGARLNNSHHSRMASPPRTPINNPMKVACGRTTGSKNQPSHCSTTAITPGHKRSDFRGGAIAISVVAMIVRAYAPEGQFVQISGKIRVICGLLSVAQVDRARLRIEIDRLRALFAHPEARFLRTAKR